MDAVYRSAQNIRTMSPLEHELAALHQPLLRFAKLQLRDEAAAEDAVSATLLAILEKPDAFKGGSSLRTYATGILKHTLVDQIRRCSRSRSTPTRTSRSTKRSRPCSAKTATGRTSLPRGSSPSARSNRRN